MALKIVVGVALKRTILERVCNVSDLMCVIVIVIIFLFLCYHYKGENWRQ